MKTMPRGNTGRDLDKLLAHESGIIADDQL
jgi:hypothetical protein